MIYEIKRIIENYLNNRSLAAIVVGTVSGGRIVIHEKLPLPMELVTGTLKQLLREGDKVRLLQNDGGQEYYILEIIGVKPMLEER